MDPLYHQTSAQFDEGGAKGLLLNNLGVYGGCRVLFDSLEVPGKCMPCENQYDKSDTIDLSFAKGVLLLVIYGVFGITYVIGKFSSNNNHVLVLCTDYVEQMVLNMQTKNEISPSLRDIVSQFDEDNRRPSDFYSSVEKSAEEVDASYKNELDSDGDAFENCGTWSYDHDEHTSVVDEDPICADPTYPSYHEVFVKNCL